MSRKPGFKHTEETLRKMRLVQGRIQKERAITWKPGMIKKCKDCERVVPIEEFYLTKNPQDRQRVSARCKPCGRKRYREYNSTPRARVAVKRYALQIKTKVMTHYAGGIPQCACCKESNMKFLSMDHINNDGYLEERKKRNALCLRLVREGYPSGFQVLCYNCNFGKAINNGKCPHKD